MGHIFDKIHFITSTSIESEQNFSGSANFPLFSQVHESKSVFRLPVNTWRIFVLFTRSLLSGKTAQPTVYGYSTEYHYAKKPSLGSKDNGHLIPENIWLLHLLMCYCFSKFKGRGEGKQGQEGDRASLTL